MTTVKPSPDQDSISYRIATLADLPAMTAILEAAGLPARLIEPFIETFIVAERDGSLVACGGIEVHADTAVLRSVAVSEALRGAGVGRGLAERLVDLALSRRVSDIYLFTAGALAFWQNRGFSEIPLAAWREPARQSWQYGYVQSHSEWAERVGVRTMWMPVRS